MEINYDEGATVLYDAITRKEWNAAAARMEHSPGEVSTWLYKSDTSTTCRWKVLPIHQACQRRPPIGIIKALLEAYPDGAKEPSPHDGNLPLHHACRWGAPVEVVELLLSAYPEGLKTKNASGRTPLDIAQTSPQGCDNVKNKRLVIEALGMGEEHYKTIAIEVQEVDRKVESEKEKPDEQVTETDDAESWKTAGLTIVVIGASGDLAKKKTYPSLLNLYADDLLPKDTIIWGYARSKMTDEELRGKLRPFLLKSQQHKEDVVDEFLSKCLYQPGKNYGDVDSLAAMTSKIEEYENSFDESKVGHNRLFYFAIPPNVFAETGRAIKKVAMADIGWTRIIVEKPFGRDLASYEELSKILSAEFNEETLYRIDHYLGKEMVQNLLILRFGNSWFERLWSRDDIQCVMLTFKEPFGTEGRGGYFDQFGIIRDILQNHLLQVLTLLAMEPPVKLNGPEASQKVRDAKVDVLNAMPPIKLEDCVLGQYEGYTDDETITNKQSNTPTFAAILLHVNTPRWYGVPFIVKAGKALNERKAEMRIQFKDAPAAEFLFDAECPRNELVIRMQPKEAIYLKTNVKSPGFSSNPVQSELEVNYETRYSSESNPDAYTRLILDVLRGRQAAFVRDDELRRSWEIFTPVLHRIENENVKPIIYKRGTRGPKEADDFIAEKCGFERNMEYKYVLPNV